MNEVNELGTLRRIVELLAAIDPWSSSGPECMVCGGETVLKRADRGDDSYFYGESVYGSHTSDCPWQLARQWKDTQ